MIWIWLWPEPKPQKERVETTDSPLGSPDNSGSDDWVFLTPSATFTATARHTAPIFLSKERTPASRVYLKKKTTRWWNVVMWQCYVSSSDKYIPSPYMDFSHPEHHWFQDGNRVIFHLLMTSCVVSWGMCNSSGDSPCCSSCLGIRWRWAITTFSSWV